MKYNARTPFARKHHGFTLIELLVVMVIIILLAALGGGALNAFKSQKIKMSGYQIAESLKSFQADARSRQTYVRIGIHETAPGSEKNVLTLFPIYSATTDLDNDDTAAKVNDPVLWPTLSKPLTFQGIVLDESLGLTTDAVLSSHGLTPFSRNVGGTNINFDPVIQFNPDGSVQISSSTSATINSFIKIAMLSPQNTFNPFLIRINGTTGSIETYRQSAISKM